MKNRIIELSKSPFLRSVAIIITGSAAAQVINTSFAPFITRIYGPEAFGVLGVFMALVGIVSPIGALTYPTAIILPKRDIDAKGLILLSLYVTAVIATLAALVLSLFNDKIISLLQIEIISSYILLIPLVIVFSTLLQVVQQWLIRTKQFSSISKATVVNALFLNSARIGFGLVYPIAMVLVIFATLGGLINALVLIMVANRSKHEQSLDLNDFIALKKLAKDYREFPLFRAPQVLINSISHSIPILILSSLFGITSAGFYSLGMTVLSIPIGVIGKSVSEVFYIRIADAAKNGENLTKMIIKATLGLIAIGIVPFGVIGAFGPWLFGFVFGSDWVAAGEYARWLTLWLFSRFINSPSVAAIPVLGLQKGLLIYEIFSTLSKIIALILGFYFFRSDVVAIALYSLMGVIAYIYLILWVIKSSRKFL